jgi:outer membrane protease
MEEIDLRNLVENKELIPFVERADDVTYLFATNINLKQKIFTDKFQVGLVYGFQCKENVWTAIVRQAGKFIEKSVTLGSKFYIGELNGTVS